MSRIERLPKSSITSTLKQSSQVVKGKWSCLKLHGSYVRTCREDQRRALAKEHPQNESRKKGGRPLGARDKGPRETYT